MAENDGSVNIPVESTADTSGFDASAAASVALGARLKELQGAEAAASAPVAPVVSAPGAPAAAAAIREVGKAGQQIGPDVKQGASTAEGALHKLLEVSKEIGSAFKAGIGLNLGERAVNAVAETLEFLKACKEEGVEVNKQFETLGVGLAASLRQADPGKFENFNSALQTAGDLLDIVKTKALELNVSATDLGHNLQVNMIALVEGGVKDLNSQVEVTGLLMQAAAAKGVTGFQAVRDIIDILNGKAERVILSRELGITNGDIAQAKAAGDLAGYLTTKLGAYKEAAAATRDTLAGLQQQQETLGKNLEAIFATGAFDNAKASARELIDIFSDPRIKTDAAEIGQAYGDALAPLIELKNGLLAGLIDVTAGVLKIIDLVNALTVAQNAANSESNKLGRSFEQQTLALQAEVIHATDLVTQAKARSDIEAALAAVIAKRASANDADKGTYDQQETILQRMLDTLSTTAGKASDLKKFREGDTENLQKQQGLLDDQLATIDKIDKTLASRATKDLKDQTPQELASRIQAQMLNANALLKQGGLTLPVDVDLSPEDITRYRDKLAAANDTKEAQASYQALRVKLSELALELSNLSVAYDASSKSAETAAKKDTAAGDKQIKARRDFIRELGDEQKARDEVARSQAELNAANAAGDRESEEGKARIKRATDDLKKTTDELTAAEQKRRDAAAKSFPEELHRIQEINDALKNTPSTGSEDTADQRAALENERRGLRDTVNGKKPTESLDDLERRSDANAAPRPDDGTDYGHDTPPSDRDNSGNRINDAADSLSETAGNTGDAAASLNTNATALQTAFGTLNDAQDRHHAAIMDGLSSQSDNIGSLIDAVQSQNGVIANQASAISQLQLQIGNLADSGGDS